MRPGVRLGIDVGSVRVGVARCDPSGLIATPEETVPRQPARGDDRSRPDLTRIAELVRDHAAVEVLVGLPRSLSGSEGAAATLTRRYAEDLAARCAPVPVRMVDERFSTVSATGALRASGVPGRKQRAVIDQAAAVVLLQNALDLERTSGRVPGEVVTPSQGETADGTTAEGGTRP